jgi:ribonuclease J
VNKKQDVKAVKVRKNTKKTEKTSQPKSGKGKTVKAKTTRVKTYGDGTGTSMSAKTMPKKNSVKRANTRKSASPEITFEDGVPVFNSLERTVKSVEKEKTLKHPRNSKKQEPIMVTPQQEIAPEPTPIKKGVMVIRSQTPKSRLKKKKPVKIIFLGGVGEIGKNMTAIEYGDDILVIDAGLTFPNNEDMPGIDAVVPDVSYLAQNKERIRGVLITHGHEDHIGGLPYLLKELNEGTPVFGTRLTLMLADNKFQEHHITRVDERVVKPGDCISVKSFKVEFINVNHSISGACALAIYTPCGIIYHSGDYKIDLTPVAGEPIDLKRIAELGQEGVLLYMAESTNIERAGYTLSETVVGTTFDHLFA